MKNEISKGGKSQAAVHISADDSQRPIFYMCVFYRYKLKMQIHVFDLKEFVNYCLIVFI